MSQESKTHTGKKERFYIVIYNAQAGRVRGRVLEQIRAFFEKRDLPYTVTDLTYCDWEDVRKKIQEYEDVRFIAAGGDGTLRMVFENLLNQNLLEVCTIAFIPLGSANVAAFSFRLPFGLSHALVKAVEGTPQPIDLGLINNKYIFFIAASFGAASNVVVGARRDLKKKLGGLAYLFNIDRLFNNDYQGESFTISFEDGGRQKK